MLPGALQFTVPLLDPFLPVGGVALLLVALGGAVSLVLGARKRRVEIDSLS
ncbi:hypothetical protein [Phaeacidiphilus oryzae]|uniref:hypothetical protein n=1 Tax=Phaeacidiphilus oryzae TaxID=348818 RepID=UPI000A5DAB9A|nr:hypothetical protein [Phaeacidiphilus oryzae]